MKMELLFVLISVLWTVVMFVVIPLSIIKLDERNNEPVLIAIITITEILLWMIGEAVLLEIFIPNFKL
jgi:hypothetical protein